MTSYEELFEKRLTRRQLVRTAAGAGGALAAGPLLAACGGGEEEKPSTGGGGGEGGFKGSGKVVIGAFEDGALVPFKQAIIPLFERETGIKLEFLEDEYGTFFEKAFNDAQTGAGQYDVYILDDPWVPQFAAAETLEDLGAGGLEADEDFIPVFIQMGFFPPKQGPRVKGFEDAEPKLVASPFVGDLQTLTYRNDVFTDGPPEMWDALVSTAKAAVGSGKIKYGYVFRGVAGNPIVTSWYPVFLCFGGRFFDDKWNPTWNDEKGKAATDFFVGTLKSLAPPGVVEFDSDQEGAAILGGKAAAVIQYSGNALKSDDASESKVPGKLDFAVVPKQQEAKAQVGIFISGVPKSAPNKENALKFVRWFAQNRIQIELARAGALPVKRPAFEDPQAAKKNRLTPVALEQLDAGAEPRPRTPDWAKVEEILGIQLNNALQRGETGNALDRAAEEARSYLDQQGYYG
ncbi:MAG: extracellular solute-binding protein [Actinomycetota bacterium]|nr:extracellular solute-binding protein [Actinomycetota bacterium]